MRPGGVTGEAAIVARYADQFAIVSALVPLPGDVPVEYYASLPRANMIDEHVWNGLQRLGLTASEPAPEHRFLRRAYLDIIGRIPTGSEARSYLEQESPNKREQLVDRLLSSPGICGALGE